MCYMFVNADNTADEGEVKLAASASPSTGGRPPSHPLLKLMDRTSPYTY